MLQSPNPSGIGDVPPGGIGQKPGGDAAGHQDEKRKELHGVNSTTMSQSPNPEDIGDVPPSVNPKKNGDDLKGHEDEKRKALPRNLSMHQFYEVKRLIEQEKEEELLHVKEDGNDKGPVNLMMDPVLNVVIACGKTDLAIRLISKLDPEKLEKKNYVGDTALHVAAAKNDHRVAKKLVAKNSGLVKLLNEKLETALHKAALNGHRDLFWWLVDEGKSNPHARRKDGATVLHCAVMGNAPVLALEIAKQYEGLIRSRNENAVTPLQLMVTVPDLFASQLELGYLDKLIYKWIPLEVDEASIMRRRRQGNLIHAKYDGVIDVADDDTYWQRIYKKFPPNLLEFITTIPVYCSRTLLNFLRPVLSRIKKLEEEKKKHREAMELTAYLADAKYMEFHQLGRTGDKDAAGRSPEVPASQKQAQQKTTTARWCEPPLILGAQMGLHDFVKKILQVCPQSVVFPDTEGRSVVRVAIESGSREILEVIRTMAEGDNPTLPSWLFSDIDPETGNTILHFAAVKGYVHGGRGEEEIKRDGDDDGKEISRPEKPEGGNKDHAEGDAIRLQYEMQWFEKVRGMIPKELMYSRNKEEKTAQEIFIESHRDMFINCKNQLIDMGNTCSTVLASLLAAAVFASSFSAPSDNDPKTELPINFSRLPFTILSHAYPIGFSSAATSLMLFLSLSTSSYKFQQFRRAIPIKYLLACLAFAITLVAFLVSFTCNIFLQIYGGRRTDRKHVVMMLLELTVFPVVCFLILFFSGCYFLPSFLKRMWPF